MYFKSIDISGFKSFVDPTTITFGQGITGIVGPNGCGKSNISDAIRWVLGEQRPKLLRGAKMDDFIFSGSASRKPGGMAEVSITIADIGGMIKRPELADFTEITVTRRLYRTGESEYQINKATCRLKDVVDLFLDTGISTRAFSIIEQDQVMRIVTSKPEERRFIIEEAAGIMKYKHRRQDALNKLENSRGNLERVSDIINELEKQRGSLKRQASKAERYKNLKAEMAQLLLATSTAEFRSLRSSEEALTAEVARLEEVRVSLETEIASRSNDAAALQASISSIAEKIAGLKEEEYQLGSSIERNEGKIALNTSQMDEADRTVARLAAEADMITQSLADMRAGVAARNETLAGIREAVSGKETVLGAKKGELAETQSGIEKLSKEASVSERELINVSGRISAASSSLAALTAKLEMLTVRLTRIEKETTEVLVTQSSAESKKAEALGLLLVREEGHKRVTETLAKLEAQRSDLLGRKTTKEREIEGVRTELTRQQARLDSLAEIDTANEGYQEGVKSLLKLKAENHDIAGRLRGTLAERIQADRRVESALETVLGDKLQALLVGAPEDAVSAIELLRARNLGRGSFLPAVETGHEGRIPDLTGSEGIIGHAGTLVQTDDELRPLLQKLLGDVLFVSDLDAAIRFNARYGLTCVTPEGDVVDRSGLISGGTEGGTASGILERKRMIMELTSVVQEAGRKVEALSAELRVLGTELAAVEASSADSARSIKEDEHRLIHERKDLEAIDSEIKRLETRLEVFRTETASIAFEQESLTAEIGRQQAEISSLGGQKTALEQEILTARTHMEEARQVLTRQQEAIAAAEVELASLKGEQNMAQADRQRIERQITESTERAVSIGKETGSVADRKRELETGIVGIKERIHADIEKRHFVGQQVLEVSDELDRLRGGFESLEKEIKGASDSLGLTRDSLGEAKLRLSETTIRLNTLSERAVEYGLSMEEIAQNDISQLDMEECQRRLSEVRETVLKIGDVNLEAIEDYRQVDERLTFLTSQRDDLIRSIEDINKVIEKINRTTRDLFDETFLKVRDNFRDIFTRLFNGGEADMVLTNEENTLESGIDIVARPPGKRKQNLTLLSAGEKAMTAVAVLFSVFKVKPSPFCLLDEVDAPLDDANIGRFKEMVKEFTRETQFLVITHNQKTMAFADRLYGITMQTPGVSTILSVDLVDTDDSSKERLKVVHG